MRLILRQNIGKSSKPCPNIDRYWPFSHVSRIVTLVEAGVDLKSLIPIEMSSSFRLFYTFSTLFFSFHFLVSFCRIALAETVGVDVNNICSLPTFDRSETQITVANKSGEFIEKFLFKLMSEMDLYTDGMPFRCFYSNNK